MTLSLFLGGCGGNSTPTSSIPDVPENTTATDENSVTGGSLNQYFPGDGDGYTVTFTQEKTGFAQADLEKDGSTVGILTINDTLNNPDAKTKFADAPMDIGGYPAVAQGSKSTAVLVGDRFQVKANSKADSFTPEDREAWLGKFDLDGLASAQ
jgi:hypothetical protein